LDNRPRHEQQFVLLNPENKPWLIIDSFWKLSKAAWSKYVWPTGHFTKMWRLPGHF